VRVRRRGSRGEQQLSSSSRRATQMTRMLFSRSVPLLLPPPKACESELASMRIRIQFFISMRIRIQEARPMRIRILGRFYSYRKLIFYIKNKLEVGNGSRTYIPKPL
jgi:hypothetical protein